MLNTGLIISGNFMTNDPMQLAQNVYVHLTKAVEDARQGGDYGPNWEQAQRYQVELLRAINDIKYKHHSKPKVVPDEASIGG